MKNTELRIGNYVKYEGELSQITGVDEDYIYLRDTVSFDYIECDEIDPIPLTEKWLLDFGFISDGSKEYQIEGNRYSLLKTDSYEGYLFCDGIKVLRELKYVHELQNLYFYLISDELIEKIILTDDF